MKIIKTSAAMQKLATDLKSRQKQTGFVPTMGFLHEGHLSLIKKAREKNQIVVVSIFVNPAQFGPKEDFGNYPRDLRRDLKLLAGYADYVFVPAANQIYKKDEKLTISIEGMNSCLCAISRSNHFAGVALVLTKLFNIIKPGRVYFGQKDYQQTVVVRELIRDFCFGISMVVCPIVREADGLAMSSRNSRLSKKQRLAAVILYRALLLGKDLIKSGDKNPDSIIDKMKNFLQQEKLARIDYVDILDAKNLHRIKSIGTGQIVIALAVYFGKTRLIDNILLRP